MNKIYKKLIIIIFLSVLSMLIIDTQILAEFPDKYKHAQPNKSIAKCKTEAKKTYDILTKMNNYYAQIMTIMHEKDPSLPAPIKKIERILDEDISFTTLTNLDKQLSDKIANFTLRDDVDEKIAEKISNLYDKINDINKEYIESNSTLQKCLERTNM